MTSPRPPHAHPDSVVQVVQRFNDAFNRHDVDAVMALMSATVPSRIPGLSPTVNASRGSIA